MADLLILTERVRNTIKLGESHFREFKSALEGRPDAKRPRKWADICRDVGEALVAFANADGGELLVGVEDDGTITGVPHQVDEIAKILEAPLTHTHAETLLPIQMATSLELDGKTVLFFSVEKGTTGVFQLPDGRCVTRSGKYTVPASAVRILFDQREARSRAYDGDFVDGAQAIDLELSLVSSMADNYLRGITPEKYLQQIGLAEYGLGGLRLRRAALLLFAKDIHRWHPRCQVRILKIEGNSLRAGTEYNVVSDEFVEGNIFELLVKSWERLRPFLAYGTTLRSDTRFEQKYIYPEWACREALVNAIAHRDYSIQSSIDVFVFTDRMEIKSPGALLSTLTIEQLLKLEGAHESRNALIAKALRESGYMRELGEGMKRIFQLMEESDLQRPDLQSDENVFSVTLYHRSVFSTQQMVWLSMFEGITLSPRQQRIVIAGIDGRELAPQDIYQAMNTDDRDTYDREVTGLRHSGILVEIRTNPQATQMSRKTGKPKSAIPRFKVVNPNQPISADIDSAVRADVHKIVVFGLPPDVVEREIVQAFERYGRVADVRIPPITEGMPTKYAFVGFADRSSLGAVLTRTEKLAIRDHPLRIELAKSSK